MFNKNTSHFMGCRCTEDTGLLFLRIAIGVPFIVHGLSKLMNVSMTNQFFSSLSLSPFFTYLVGGSELLAGIMILLGIWAFIGGYIVSIIMVCTYSLVKNKAPFLGGYELDFAFFFGGLAIAMIGSGKYSLIKKPKNICVPGTCEEKNIIPHGEPGHECDGKGGCADGVATIAPGLSMDDVK